MKRILSFIIIYIGSLFLSTLLLAVLFMFSCTLTNFVTSLPYSFFSLKFFMSGILLSVPLSCVITQILFCFYAIRHPSNHIISLILYAALGAVSWLLVIPTDLHLISRYEADVVEARVSSSSTGVFRQESNGVYYFSRINEKNEADGIFFDTTGFAKEDDIIVPFFGMSVKNESAFPYSDIIIKNSLQPSLLVSYPLAIYNSLLTVAGYASSLGFLAWLSFASLGLALLCVYGIQFFSSWKLSNVLSLIISVSVIIFVNYLYYMNLIPDSLREVSAKLSEVVSIKDPLIVLINLIFSALLVLSGVFMGIYRLKESTVFESADE